MKYINSIRHCNLTDLPVVEPETRTGMIIHRCGLGSCAADVAKAYMGGVHEAAQATGGHMPYHVVVRADGTIDQALPLCVVAPHARRYNQTCIGVGVVGDFRVHAPTQHQIDALREFAHICSGWLCDGIMAHDSLVGASSDPNKSCPGRYFDVRDLESQVALADLARVRCVGVRIEANPWLTNNDH